MSSSAGSLSSWILWLAAVAALASLVAVVAWVRRLYRAEDPARAGLESTAEVEVASGEWLVFRPRQATPLAGVIFYPGGKAEPVAYAPALRALAALGFLVVLVPMPLNLAVIGRQRGAPVLARFPGIRRWVIAGHSLGGAIACQFAHRHAAQLAGLVIWASYPGKETDLSAATMPVLSVAGGADDLTTAASLAEARPRLPPQARVVTVEGADHWTFGHFAVPGALAGADRDRLQARILEITATFLREVGQN